VMTLLTIYLILAGGVFQDSKQTNITSVRRERWPWRHRHVAKVRLCLGVAANLGDHGSSVPRVAEGLTLPRGGRESRGSRVVGS
jgi:hypothetical protein